MRRLNLFLAALVPVVALAGPVRAADAPAPEAVVGHYADLAAAIYGDAATTAEALKTSVAAFLAKPDDQTLAAARAAWKAARVPYQQSEGFRFGNAFVDDWRAR